MLKPKVSGFLFGLVHFSGFLKTRVIFGSSLHVSFAIYDSHLPVLSTVQKQWAETSGFLSNSVLIHVQAMKSRRANPGKDE